MLLCVQSPLGFWINTVGQEINLQCETDVVCVWLNDVSEFLKLALNPQVKNSVKKLPQTASLYCYLYFHNVHPKPQRDYIYTSTHYIYVCVYIFMWKQSMTRKGTHEIKWTKKLCRIARHINWKRYHNI